MATHSAVRRWTYEEFAALPDDGNRYEIIAGELYMTPAPRPVHQEIVARLTVVLYTFVREHDLGWSAPGPIDVLFKEGDYLEPDFVFVSRERLQIITDRGLKAAPDLVIEVVSPGTALRDRTLKRERYAHFGVPEYWVVDVEAHQVEVYRLGDDPARPRIKRETLTWRPIPDGPALEISLDELFRDPGSQPLKS